MDRKKILAVDDEPAILSAVKDTLSDKFDVFTAVNGLEAVKAAGELKPDLIIMDVMMPELDGFEAVKQMRLAMHSMTPPVIFLSAKSSRADIEQGLKLSGYDYITKPFSPAKLVKKAEEVFERVEIRKKLQDKKKL
jgi:DNA-binding response OmpR family regulator